MLDLRKILCAALSLILPQIATQLAAQEIVGLTVTPHRAPEAFDISGCWIASDIGGRNSLTIGEYLRTLKRMHINTGQIEEVAGYTDDPELYAKYPFKRFNRM